MDAFVATVRAELTGKPAASLQLTVLCAVRLLPVGWVFGAAASRTGTTRGPGCCSGAPIPAPGSRTGMSTVEPAASSPSGAGEGGGRAAGSAPDQRASLLRI